MSETIIFFILLFAALCHSGWSSIIKGNPNPLGILGMTGVVEIIIFFPLLFLVPFPTIEIWCYIFASVVLHGLYRLNVFYSYQYGDLSFVYPIARGSSSLMIALISVVYLSDQITLIGFGGILIVCIGLFLISYSKINQFKKIALTLSITTAILITIYTIVDGIGIRLSNNGYSYLFWMLFLNGMPVLLFSIVKKDIFKLNKSFIIWGIFAGCLAILSYGLVVWSMQYLEIAYVSSIRESSIVIATIIGLVILKEKTAKQRILPAILVLIGISVLYFQI